MLFSDPAAERLNKALTKDWKDAYLDEARDPSGKWSGLLGDIKDSLAKAKDASDSGDHDGSIKHLDDAYAKVAQRSHEGRLAGEGALHPAQQRDKMLANSIRGLRASEAAKADEADRQARSQSRHGLFHRG